MTIRLWIRLGVGAVLCAISLSRLIPPFTRPGDFTDFGAGFMIGNGLLLLIGVVLIAMTWRQRPKQ